MDEKLCPRCLRANLPDKSFVSQQDGETLICHFCFIEESWIGQGILDLADNPDVKEREDGFVQRIKHSMTYISLTPPDKVVE